MIIDQGWGAQCPTASLCLVTMTPPPPTWTGACQSISERRQEELETSTFSESFSSSSQSSSSSGSRQTRHHGLSLAPSSPSIIPNCSSFAGLLPLLLKSPPHQSSLTNRILKTKKAKTEQISSEIIQYFQSIFSGRRDIYWSKYEKRKLGSTNKTQREELLLA